MAGPPRCLPIRGLLQGQPSLTFALGVTDHGQKTADTPCVCCGSRGFDRSGLVGEHPEFTYQGRRGIYASKKVSVNDNAHFSCERDAKYDKDIIID
jgi:hypothetical protein